MGDVQSRCGGNEKSESDLVTLLEITCLLITVKNGGLSSCPCMLTGLFT